MEADRRSPMQQHVARIQARVDSHDSDPGLAFAVGNGPLDRRGAAIFRKQRRMYVQDSMLRNIDDALRNDLPVAHDHHDVGFEFAQRRDVFRTPNSLRLQHQKPVPGRPPP